MKSSLHRWNSIPMVSGHRLPPDTPRRSVDSSTQTEDWSEDNCLDALLARSSSGRINISDTSPRTGHLMRSRDIRDLEKQLRTRLHVSHSGKIVPVTPREPVRRSSVTEIFSGRRDTVPLTSAEPSADVRDDSERVDNDVAVTCDARPGDVTGVTSHRRDSDASVDANITTNVRENANRTKEQLTITRL